jgi:hypothetical protein
MKVRHDYLIETKSLSCVREVNKCPDSNRVLAIKSESSDEFCQI